MKVLIVDDKPENVYLLESLFKGSGYETSSADNGATALEAALKDHFDLIISDILMPVMDGFTFCRECKKSNHLKNIPFIFYTATYTDSKDEEFALSLGADKFILKPQEPDVFMELVNDVLKDVKEEKYFSNKETSLPENVILKEYNERLIRKLEHKMQQTEENEKQLKSYVKKLQQNKLELTSIFNTTGDVLYYLEVGPTNKYCFISVNTAFCKVTGIPFEKVIGKTINEIIPEPSLSMVLEKYQLAIKNKTSVHWEETSDYPVGRLTGEVSVAPIFDNMGNCTHLVGTVHDITDRKKYEAELFQAKEKAEEMNRLKSSFLANMSHELRTPMIGILGFAEMLVEESKDPETNFAAATILESGQRLMKTLNMILDLSKIESGKLRRDYKSIDVIKIIVECCVLFQREAFKKSLSLDVDLKCSSLELNIDEDMFRDIINNLVNNAIKFTKQGGVKVEVNIEESGTGNCAVINVRDTGIGIAKENQPAIWEEFRQVSEGFGRNFEGTGLGLTIAKKFIEIMKGSITVESELNVGSVFTVRFPVSQSVNSEKPKATVKETKEVKTTVKSMHNLPDLLYVEDDPISAFVVRKVLSPVCEVDIATNSEAAIKKVSSKQYAVILMDINLGHGADGLNTTKIIRQFESYKQTPIIAISAYAMPGDKEEFLQAGCSSYISKPFELNVLFEMVSGILEGSTQ